MNTNPSTNQRWRHGVFALTLPILACFSPSFAIGADGKEAPAREAREATREPGKESEKPRESEAGKPAQPLRHGQGTFVSYKDGTLTLTGRDGLLEWKNIDGNTKTFLATGEDRGEDRGYKPAATIETLGQVKPGTRVFVGTWFGYEKRSGIFIGVNGSRVSGTFVSFTQGTKNAGLTLIGKDLATGSFAKKYGNSLFMRPIPQDLRVEESIDGGDYKPSGTAGAVLPTVKEGTLVTVHFLGEGNITLIQLGSPAKK